MPAKAKARRKTASKAKRKPASKPLHTERFPGESKAYRSARDKLLKAEIELRSRIEAVAAMRRKLPPGGAVPQDYEFEEGTDAGTVRRVRLSELFQPGKDTLVLYSFMYGPAMAKPCPMCSAMLDSLDGSAPHLSQRINLAVVAKSPIARIRDAARTRGWRNMRLISSAANTYNRDYRGETADGSQMPALNVFIRRGGRIHHAYGTELLFAPREKGQDGRHVDSIWPLWNLFDFTPEGRGATWYPKLQYEAQS
jgi:predicted dithiol-disulfide oxidoreductase (DUF899 family)